jgi:hypothetical protein
MHSQNTGRGVGDICISIVQAPLHNNQALYTDLNSYLLAMWLLHIVSCIQHLVLLATDNSCPISDTRKVPSSFDFNDSNDVFFWFHQPTDLVNWVESIDECGYIMIDLKQMGEEAEVRCRYTYEVGLQHHQHHGDYLSISPASRQQGPSTGVT